MHREFSPLVKADDAIEIDSSDITKEEVVTKIFDYSKEIYRKLNDIETIVKQYMEDNIYE